MCTWTGDPGYSGNPGQPWGWGANVGPSVNGDPSDNWGPNDNVNKHYTNKGKGRATDEDMPRNSSGESFKQEPLLIKERKMQ